jgi:hypothetical protein
MFNILLSEALSLSEDKSIYRLIVLRLNNEKAIIF